MNIIEAIKSGKPFKRKEWSTYYKSSGYKIQSIGNQTDMLVIEKDMIADDWEIQEKTITITESQFDELWNKYLDKSFSKDLLKKELGF